MPRARLCSQREAGCIARFTGVPQAAVGKNHVTPRTLVEYSHMGFHGLPQEVPALRMRSLSVRHPPLRQCTAQQRQSASRAG